MWTLFAGIFVTWLTSALGHLNTLFNKRLEKHLAAVFLILATGSAAYAAFGTYRHMQVKEIYRSKDDDRALELGEASGGATDGQMAYVVNDETTGVFVSPFDPTEGRFENFTFLALTKCGADLPRQCTPLEKSDVDDLEGAAVDPRATHRALYLVTSHSNNKNGHRRTEREALLRLDLDTKTTDSIEVSGRVNLRPALEKVLFGINANPPNRGIAEPFAYKRTNDDTSQVERIQVGMEIEGLAVDAEGTMYIGLRAPLCRNGGAIIVTAKADDLFVDSDGELTADLTPHCIGSEQQREYYAVVSMEYDSKSGDIAVLTGTPYPYRAIPPLLCHWSIASSQLRACRQLPPLSEVNPGKQEALLLPQGDDRVVTMLDSDKGLGGQITYSRYEAGLP